MPHRRPGEADMTTRELVRDPVCGMMVDPEQTPWQESHEGKTYFFCNPRCAGKFRSRAPHYVEALAVIWDRTPSPDSSGASRLERVRRKYRRNARWYDRAVERATGRLRRAAVARLALSEGARVLDLGCGTGLSFPLLRAAVGNSGVVYGVDASRDMLAVAHQRCSRAGWENVRLLEADAEAFELPEQVDGLLCFYTNDIVRSDAAVARALQFLRPGATVVAAGAKLARGWRGLLVNPITRAYSSLAITHPLVHEPYAKLRGVLASFSVEEQAMGSGYLARGVLQA